MRNAYIFHRYRKWKRKAFKASDPNAQMKWKYWRKLYGQHECIWHPKNQNYFNPPA